MTKMSLWKATRFALPVILFLALSSTPYARNEILGKLEFVAESSVEMTSGVWVDGQYVGYLGELYGPRKVLLLPGEHLIVVRQAGYKDFIKRIALRPGDKQEVYVSMEDDPQALWPQVKAEVKLEVRPGRAAVFVDDLFAGHVDEFNGMGRGMILAAGRHNIKIALPGFETFETEVKLLPDQRFKIKTDLLEATVAEAGPPIKKM